MLMAKLLGESSGIEVCHDPRRFWLAENVISVKPIAIVKAKIWKELPNFLRLSSDKANNIGPEAPRPVLFFPSSKYMDPIPNAEKLMTPKKIIKDKVNWFV